MKKFNKSERILRDVLAEDRTKMANERTLLSYFRTMIVLLSSGIAILKLSWLTEIEELGVCLVLLAPIIMSLGLFNYYKVKKRIISYYI